MKINVVCVTYLEDNQKYLDLFVRSLNRQSIKDDISFTLVSSGEYLPHFQTDIKSFHRHSGARLHYPPGVNLGVKTSVEEFGDPEYIFIANDDIILKERSLETLYHTSKGLPPMILNGLSNCDNHLFFSTPAFQRNQFRIEDIDTTSELLFKDQYLTEMPFVMYVNQCCLYATMIDYQNVWKKLGPLDPAYKTGFDDQDYATRAHREGIRSGICLNTIITHFSGTTADKAITKEDREFNERYYREKWTQR